MKKRRQISLQECYEILLLNSDATLEEVKKSYRKRAFELHPDLNPDVADASSQFKRLNEAYVALSQVLQTEEKAKATQKEDKKTKAEPKKEEQKPKTEKKAQEKASKEQQKTTKTSTKKEQEQKKEEPKTKAQANRQRAASAAYAKEDVLRDLLHDPFARRVFEDIYSEVNKQATPENGAPKPPPPPPPPPQPEPKTPPTVEVDLGPSNNLSHFANNFSGKIMGWFRHQIDEEQSIKLPASALFAGAKVRLQIRQGLSEEVSTIEIVLPKDFVVGKPIRLRGLGKKVGKWQGDLYLTIECNQDPEK